MKHFLQVHAVGWLALAAACGSSPGQASAGGSTAAGDSTSAGEPTSASEPTSGGEPTSAGEPNTGDWDDLDEPQAPPHPPVEPDNDGEPTRGGTLTFTNIGAPGYWGRRIEAGPGDPRCDVQSEVIDFGWGEEFCCRTRHEVTSDQLTPFNEQLHLVLEGPLRVTALAVYQPLGANDGPWAIRSLWDRRAPDQPYNLHLSGPNGAPAFVGDLGNNCAYYAMQARPFPCGPGSEPYCPGSALDYYGWPGSKLVVLLASMPYADDPALQPLSCIGDGEDEREQDAPWIGVSPSELNRDGWSGYHPCHCFNNTDNGQLGDGCGQINVFEVIAEASGPQWGNRDIISTGIRSYQVGSLGGVTCGIESCGIDQFPTDADLVDVNSLTAMNQGAVIDADAPAMAAGPAWRRAQDDRYYLFLMDEGSRTVQVAVIHPGEVPAAAAAIVPALPNVISREVVDGFLKLRLPQ